MAPPTPGTEPTKVADGPTQEHRFPAIWPGTLGMLLLLLAVPKMPSGYYDYVLPISVVTLSAVMVVLAGGSRRWVWVVPFLLVSFFFNPIRRPGLTSVFQWQLADVVGATFFLLGAYFIYPKREALEKTPAFPHPRTKYPGVKESGEQFEVDEFVQGVASGRIKPCGVRLLRPKHGLPFMEYDFPEFRCQIHVHFKDEKLEDVVDAEVVDYARKEPGHPDKLLSLGYLDNYTVAMLRKYDVSQPK